MSDERVAKDESIYHIRVKGNLDEKWAEWFEGFAMASRDNGETLLCGPVMDQAALHGVLGKLRSLGLPLLFVAQTVCPCSQKSCPSHGSCSGCVTREADRGKLPFCLRRRSRWDRQCASFKR